MGERKMRVLISGSTGLIGQELTTALKQAGNEAVSLSRQSKLAGPTLIWNPPNTPVHPSSLNGFQAIIHLAGDSIADGRWTAAKKTRIRDSRVEGTRSLVESVLAMTTPPQVFISASAIGFYGDRGTEILNESSSAGRGFLPEVCQAWEAASRPLSVKGIRVVHLRFGIILSNKGGALAKMLPPFKLGAGGILGSGKQYMSWVSLDDAIHTIIFALRTQSLEGPVNVTAPQAVTNLEFTKTLGGVLHRPTLLPMPAPVARLIFGEMADALLLCSAKVQSEVLQKAGYTFKDPTLDGALKRILDS